jgi:phosphomannomutase
MTLIKSISGIRGTIGGETGENLTPIDAVKFAAAYGTWLQKRNPVTCTVVIGRDARPSGEMISQLVSQTLVGLGIHVIDLGLSTTPTVEVAVPMENAHGGIILTASHNPVQWNALKLLNEKGEFVSGEDGAEILRIAEAEEFKFAGVTELGNIRQDDTYMEKHIKLILDHPLVDVEAIKAKGYTVAVDAVNSTGGTFIPYLLEKLGVKCLKLYCEPNGKFPHNPEPLPENLTDISELIKEQHADLGIVVDPDVDRLALLCEDGSMFGEEYTLVAVADYFLKNKGGNTVSNLSSTRALRDVTQSAGYEYHASAVGEVNVVTKMKEVNAVIGGEGNGGIIVPDLHYGRDALAGIALFLSHLAKSNMSCSELRKSYPEYTISKNKIQLTPEINVDSILEKVETKFAEFPLNTVDGVKVEFDKGWVHLRKSNTEPIIRVYSEGPDSETAGAYALRIIDYVDEIK